MMVNGKFITPPSMTDIMDAHSNDIGSKLRVCITGEIAAFDPIKRTASVLLGEPLILSNGTVIPVLSPLLDVPVVTLQGGGIHLGLPVGIGDECLVVFADFNIGAWFAAGGQQIPPDNRQHDLSDGIAIVGLNSLANPLVSPFLETEGGIANEGEPGAAAKVGVDNFADLVVLENAAGGKLKTILTTLLTSLDLALVALGGDTGLSSGTRSACTTAAAAGAAAITQIAALLK